MKLPVSPAVFTAQWGSEITRRVEQLHRETVKTNSDVNIADGRLILTSPDGTRFSITVDNAGTLAATAV